MGEISDADKKLAEDLWPKVTRVYQQTNGQLARDTGIEMLANFRAQARREGRRAGIEEMRKMNDAAANLLEAEK